MLQSKLLTYKYFEAYADAHQSIERIGFEFEEQLENFASEKKEYPILFVAPTDSPNLQKGLRNHGFRIYCLDIIQTTDRSNVSNLINKTDLILSDFIQHFHRDGDSPIYLQEEPIIIPVNNYLNDYTTGHFIDVLVQSRTTNSCGAPIEGFTPPPSGECSDATYIVEYDNGTIIEQGTVPSGGSVTIEVDDPIVCQDATWQLLDSDGNVLDSGSIASGGSATITAPNATNEIYDTDSNLLYTETIPSGDTASTTIQDSDIKINNTSTFSILAEGVKNIIPKDLEGNVLAVDSVSGDDLNLNIVKGSTAPLMATGQTTSYATGDDGDIQSGREFFTLQLAIDVITLGALSGGNWTGNTNRFTDTDGAQVYGNDIVLDWSTYDALTGNVLGYYIDLDVFGFANWATQISNANVFTTSGFSNWRLSNINESLNLYYNEIGSKRLNYAPFNVTSGVWYTSTSVDADNAYIGRSGNNFVDTISKTIETAALMVRTFNISEL